MKADEPQADQRHEDVEKKLEFYHIVFPERCKVLHQERIGQVDIMAMEYFNSILFHKSEEAYLSIIQCMGYLATEVIVSSVYGYGL